MTSPKAPMMMIQMGGFAPFARKPFLYTSHTVVRGPAMYPTSPAPWAKMTQHAEKTCRAETVACLFTGRVPASCQALASMSGCFPKGTIMRGSSRAGNDVQPYASL